MSENCMRPIHPGEVLREEFLMPLDMRAHALAQALRVPAPRINDIVRERRESAPIPLCAWPATSVPRRSSG